MISTIFREKMLCLSVIIPSYKVIALNTGLVVHSRKVSLKISHCATVIRYRAI